MEGGVGEQIGNEATITTTGFQSISKTILLPSKLNGSNQQKLSPVQQAESVGRQEFLQARIQDLHHSGLDEDAARVREALDDDAETLKGDITKDCPEQYLLGLVTKTSGRQQQITRSELGLS
jgi:hypothetical protein